MTERWYCLRDIWVAFVMLAVTCVGVTQPISSITGRVVDGETNEPLSGVNVTLAGTDFGAATDLDGNYAILGVPPGTYIMRFSYVGFETVERSDVMVMSAKPTVIDEALTAVALRGEDVVVSVGFFRQELQAPVSTTRLSREEIRRFPGGFEDVVRTVSTLPGVAVVNEGGRNDLLVRGGGPSENLYVVNGMEVPNINHFGTQGSSSGSLSFINLDFVDDVEFSAGGFGAEYGDKLSSVISLKMRPSRTDRFGGKALISATQYGVDVEGPLGDRGGVIASARKSYLDLLFRALDQPFIPVYTDYNVFANYDVTPRDKLYILGLAAIDRVDRDQTTLENRVTNAGIMDNTQDQVIAGVNYRRIRRLGVTDVTCNFNSVTYRFSQVDEQEEEYFRSETDEREGVLKVESEVRVAERLKMQVGGTLKRGWIDSRTVFADSIYDRSGNKVTPYDLGLPNLVDLMLTADKYAGFVAFVQQWTPLLETTVGVRGDYYDFLDDKFYPSVRVLVGYQLTSRTKLKTSAGRYYQAPSYAWVLNPYNRALSALRNDMGVVGINYLIRDYLSVEVEGYYKRYGDLPTGATPELSYLVLTNAGVGYGGREDDFQSFGFIPLISDGEGEAYGVEISLQKKYSKDCCYGQAALSIGKSEYTAANGETYPGQFDQTVVFSINWGFKPNPRWEYSAKFRAWTGAPYTPVYRPSENDGMIQNVPEEYLSERLKAGHHLDVRVDRRFNFTGWTLIAFVDVQNVYDNKIERRPTYDFWTDEVENTNTIGILPSIGISTEF